MDFLTWLTDVYAVARVPINIVLIIVVALIIRAILLSASDRLIRQIVTGVKKKNGHTEEVATPGVPANVSKSRQVQRTATMGAVFHNSISWAIYIIAFIQILQELGVPVVAIVASAGIGAAALGFGAQNVIKDILNGMFLVFEDQLGVGDKVDLGLAVGTVDSVGLRITVLHDDKGTVWFVRNGEIVRVGNMSYKQSQPVARVKKPSTSAKKK